MSVTDIPHVQTLIEAVHYRADVAPDEVAFYDEAPTGWIAYTNRTFLQDIQALAYALQARGIVAGDRIALMGRPGYWWEVCDKAVMYLGAVTVGLDERATPTELALILQMVQAKGLFADTASKVKTQIVPAQLARLSFVAVFANDDLASLVPQGALLQTLLDAGRGQAPSVRSGATADGLGALVFTSGTTGAPKGIPFTHRQLTCSLPLIHAVFLEQEGVKHHTLAWLPLHNGTGRMMSTVNFFYGCTQYFVKDPYSLFDKIKQVQPTYLVLMPRMLEKVYGAVQQQLRLRSRALRWCLAGLIAWRTAGMPAWCERWFERKIGMPLRHKIWGAGMQFMLCGSAPVDPKILRFFAALGLPTYEVYGLSEIPMLITMNRPDALRYGSVGQPLPGNDVRLAQDGEVLLRSDLATRCYWGEDPQGESAAALRTDDGYFRTGDLAEWRDGFLYLLGRKKEIIKTSTGQRIAPAAIEAAFLAIPGLANFVVIGNARRFLSALVALEPEFVAQAEREGIGLNAYLEREIQQHNQSLALHQQVKKFVLLQQPLSVEQGEMTPSLKIRRMHVEEKYKSLIDTLYAENAASAARQTTLN